MSTPLRDLDGKVTTIDYGQGLKLPCVTFVCPICDGQDGRACHYNVIPYSDQPFHEVPRPGGGVVKLWQRISGSTLDDLTLAPSYHLTGRYIDEQGVEHTVPTCGLHGFVQNGQWVPC